MNNTPLLAKLEKFVPGGQVIGIDNSNGKKIFIWGGLPDELVEYEILRKKKSWLEGTALRIVKPSINRILCHDKSFMATSPWQILKYEEEIKAKKELLHESFKQYEINLPNFNFLSGDKEKILYYRNKMEFSFFHDHQEGLKLCFFSRGGKYKIPVDYCSIAKDAINKAAQKIVNYLQNNNIEARQLKSVVLRCSQKDQVAASLYLKDRQAIKFIDADKLIEEALLSGIRIWFSNPKSPASVQSENLAEAGDLTLSDQILDKNFVYDVDSFFQVNIEIFSLAVKDIADHLSTFDNVIDMYCGVGCIGICTDAKKLSLIEINHACVNFADINASNIRKKNELFDTKIIMANCQEELDFITNKTAVIIDPPRAGLHKKTIQKILQNKPPILAYLSCNPATQARDISYLLENYVIDYFAGYNFFPRTPHIESLAILRLCP